MEKIEISGDGIYIPAPGNMKITVEMTEGIFEEFMEYRRAKVETEKRENEQLAGLRCRMNSIAEAILTYFNTKSTKERSEAKEDALELANDWFA